MTYMGPSGSYLNIVGYGQGAAGRLNKESSDIREDECQSDTLRRYKEKFGHIEVNGKVGEEDIVSSDERAR